MPQNFPPGNSKFFGSSSPVALVAGGAGFVGSHVCEALLGKGVRVICLDNWLTGVRENIKHLEEDLNFFLLDRDISEKIPDEIPRLDYVFHLAGIEAHLNGEDVSIETLEANSIGSKNLLELARKHGARFLLASTINIFSGQISKESTREYFGKTRGEEGEFSQIEAKRFAEALTSEYGQKKGVNVRIVRLGDVYGPRMLLSSGSPLSRLIKETLYNQDLVVPQEGFIFPVYIDDVVSGIVKALLSSGTRGAILSLAGPKTSIFSVAQVIQRTKGGSTDLVFTKREFREAPAPEGVPSAGQTLISWQRRVDLLEGITKTLDWFSRNRNRIPKSGLPEKEDKEAEKKQTGGFWSDVKVGGKSKNLFKKNKWLGLGAILLGLFWFFALPFLEVGAGILQLHFAKNATLAGDTKAAEVWSSRARIWFGWSKEGFSRWEKLPPLGDKAAGLEEGARILAAAAEIGELSGRTLGGLAQLFENALGSLPSSSRTNVDSLSFDLKTLEERLGFLEADLEEGSRPPFVGQKLLSQSLDISTLRKAVGLLTTILPQTPDLLGEVGKKTYLILLQDNTRLRPGGGLIGAFALVTLNGGRVVSFDVQDVEQADGQLKGHVEPPPPIKDYLGEANWFLRDSNWSPDFPTSAARAAWFIDKELGIKVDGVLSIDLEFVKHLFERLRLNQEASDFRAALGRQVLQIVTNLPKESFATFGKATLSALDGRHLLFWTENREVNTALKRAGWDGSFLDTSCGTGCTGDYLQVVEANFGNTSNNFIARAYDLEVSVNNQQISHSLSVSYTGEYKNDPPFGEYKDDYALTGEYKNYIRLFTSPGSAPGRTYLLDPATGIQEELKLDVSQEKGREVFGTLLTIPANQSRTVSFWWDTPVAENKGELSLFWQKQAGTLDDPVRIKINPPKDKQSLSSNKQSLSTNKQSLSTNKQSLSTNKQSLSSIRSFTVPKEPSLTAQGSIGYNIPLSRDIEVNVKWQQ